jgi:ABC-type Na+ transport system ATPase subunit NatA
MCDCIGVLHDGRLAFDGAPAALKERDGSPSLERAFLAVIEGES